MDDQKRSQVLDNYPDTPTDSLAQSKTDEQSRLPKKAATPDLDKKQNTTSAPAVEPIPIVKAPVSQQSTRKSLRTKIITGVLAALVLIAVGALVGWFTLLAPQNVTAYQIGKRQNVAQVIGGGGIVYPKQKLDLSFPVAERAINVMVKAGDKVKKNQALIKLDPTQLNAQVTQASNDVQAARAYLNSVSGAFPYNPVAVAAAQQDYEVAKNRYNALVAQTANPTLKNGNLIAPVDGVVTVVNINPGEVFAANTILLTLTDQSTVTVRAKLPLSNLGQISIGNPAEVTPSALPNVKLKGTVISVVPQADPQTDTFEVWVNVDNQQQTLVPGMSAFARVNGEQNAFVVPRVAVLNPDRESAVMVIRNGKAYMQQVHITGRTIDNYFIDSGIDDNDQIVLTPLNKLHHGQAVKVNEVRR